MDKVNYEYDVFLSWTGKDRILKDQIRAILEENNFKVYDSDRDCVGNFREDYARAIAASKVFMPILTNNLLNDPNMNGVGSFSEVRSEFDLARDADARGILNIEIVCFTERVKDWFVGKNDVDRYFCIFASSNGNSRVDGTLVKKVTEENQEADENAPYVMREKTLLEILHKVTTLVRKRDAGDPVPTQHVHLDVEEEGIYGCSNFAGRDDEIKEIASAFFDDKARAVVLRGIGGIGKSELAKKFANEYNNKEIVVAQFVYLPDSFEYSEDIDVQLYNLLNNIDYVPHVRAELREQTARKDQLDIMLGAISKLPPYALLIIDNCNFHYTAVLTKLLQKTKCNYLLTSRIIINDVEYVNIPGRMGRSPIKDIDVNTLPEETAFDYFEKESGRQFSFAEFCNLYELLGGNTICLCLMARILRANSHKNIDDIINEFLENRSKEDIRITHNGTDMYGSISKHLGALFNMNQLSEKCKDILRGMSLLDNGTLTMDEIRALYCLENNNEINALTESGWLHSYDNNALVMHPVIAHLAVQKLNPNKEKDKNIIDYLLDKANNARSLPVNEALHIENKQYYALLILARSEGHLCKPLWNCFVDINSCHASYKEVEEKKKQLFLYITDEDDLNVLSSYTDMVLVRQNPSAIEVLEKYLDKLSEGTDDYKWVSQMLSVSISRVIVIPKHKKKLGSILHNALDKAMEGENDAAIVNLSIYLCFVEGYDSYKKTLLPYIKAEKKKGRGNNVKFLEMLLWSFRFFPKDAFTDYQKFFKCYSSLVRFIFGEENDSDKKLLPYMSELIYHPFVFTLKHPTFVIKAYILSNYFKNSKKSQDNRQNKFIDLFSEIMNEFEYTGEFNFSKLFECSYEYCKYLYDEGVSLVEPYESSMGTIALMLDALPADIREILMSNLKSAENKRISEHKLGGRYTFRDVALQDGYLLVLRAEPAKDKKILMQVYQAHQEKLHMLYDMYPEDDYRVIDERIELAEIAEKIGGPIYSKIALDEYKYIYDKFLRDNDNSGKWLRVGGGLLRAPNGSIWKDIVVKDKFKAEKQLRELAIKMLDLSKDSAQKKASIIKLYICRLVDFSNLIIKENQAKTELPSALLRLLKKRSDNKVKQDSHFSEGLLWAAEQLKIIIGLVSRSSSDDEIKEVIDTIVSLLNNIGLLCADSNDKQNLEQKCVDMMAILKLMVKKESGSKKTKKWYSRTIKNRYAMIEAEQVDWSGLFKTDDEEAMNLYANALRIACRNGVFNCGFLKKRREIYLLSFLQRYNIKCKSANKTPTAEWVNLLLGKYSFYKKRILKLYDKMVKLIIEKAEAAKKELGAVFFTFGTKEALSFVLETSIKYLSSEIKNSDFVPKGIEIKEYGKCRSVDKYVLLILEAVYKNIQKVGFAFRKYHMPIKTVTIPSPTAIPSDKK